MRPNTLDVPRMRASWPSAQSKMADRKIAAPPTCMCHAKLENRDTPPTSPNTMEIIVTRFGDTGVGSRARASR